MTDTPILETRELTRRFGGFSAVSHVDLAIRRGTIHAVIGPNGAGKTTLFNLMTGVLPPTEGQIIIDGADVSGARPGHHRAMRRGAHVPGRTPVCIRMTALENVEVGRFAARVAAFSAAVARVPGLMTVTEAKTRRRAEELLDRVGLSARRNMLAGELALADQRRLEVARALAVEPQLLLLDEPVAGMNPVEVHQAGDLYKSLVKDGVTILITEHHMSLVMAVSDQISVMNYGRKIAEGSPDVVRANPDVIAAYLGAEAAAAC